MESRNPFMFQSPPTSFCGFTSSHFGGNPTWKWWRPQNPIPFASSFSATKWLIYPIFKHTKVSVCRLPIYIYVCIYIYVYYIHPSKIPLCIQKKLRNSMSSLIHSPQNYRSIEIPYTVSHYYWQTVWVPRHRESALNGLSGQNCWAKGPQIQHTPATRWAEWLLAVLKLGTRIKCVLDVYDSLNWIIYIYIYIQISLYTYVIIYIYILPTSPNMAIPKPGRTMALVDWAPWDPAILKSSSYFLRKEMPFADFKSP